MRLFEVLRRDGPARLGKLNIEGQEGKVLTPTVLGKDSYVVAGNLLSYSSLEAARAALVALKDDRRLLLAPYIPSPQGIEPVMNLFWNELSTYITQGSKLALQVNPALPDLPGQVEIYFLSWLTALESRPRELVTTLTGVRERVPPDSALWATAVATPANLSLLVYMGVDLVDQVRMEMDAYFGRYHTTDGPLDFFMLRELPCPCSHCQELSEREFSTGEPQGPGAVPSKELAMLLARHNMVMLDREAAHTRELIRRQMLREYVERQVRVSPSFTAALRFMDQNYEFLERRTPSYRPAPLLAISSESLHRVEVVRFAKRVQSRYRAPQSDVLLLLPCSARKPYSRSRSHRLYTQTLGGLARYLHEVILTSPLAVVPRELEDAYPAASYDIPVTGLWDLEERHWLIGCLDQYLHVNSYGKIVAHLEGELAQIVQDHGLEATFTGGGTSPGDLERLKDAVSEACQGARRLGDPRLRSFRARADFYLGMGAGDALFSGKVRIKGHQVLSEEGRVLAMETVNRLLALSLEGARRLEGRGQYLVRMGDFVPKGSLLAPGVEKADHQIRPGDEVIVRGERVLAVGRARMSGWEMESAHRGTAVELRQVEEV